MSTLTQNRALSAISAGTAFGRGVARLVREEPE
jgi:hypothetical protein